MLTKGIMYVGMYRCMYACMYAHLYVSGHRISSTQYTEYLGEFVFIREHYLDKNKKRYTILTGDSRGAYKTYYNMTCL